MSEVVVVDQTTGEVQQETELDRSWQELERAATVPDVATLVDKAAAFQAIARNGKLGLNRQNDWAEFKIAAMRRGGQMLGEVPRWGAGRPPKLSHGETVSLPTVSDLLDEKNTHRAQLRAARWRTLAAIADAIVSSYFGQRRDDDEEITEAGLLAAASKNGKLIVASDENEWYTPEKYLHAARSVLGGIDLDPASSAYANHTVKAQRYYTQDQDGLKRPWRGNVWLNPPYGRLAGDFVERLDAEHRGGTVPAAIALVNAHCTDTAWFQPLFAYLLCFTDHRIDFDSAGRDKTTSSTHGSVFAYLGPDPEAFAKAFSEFGTVVRRWS